VLPSRRLSGAPPQYVQSLDKWTRGDDGTLTDPSRHVTEVLASLGTTPRSLLHRAGVDAREDWHPALRGQGLNSAPYRMACRGAIDLPLGTRRRPTHGPHRKWIHTRLPRLAYEIFDDTAAVRRDPNLEETKVKTGMDFVGLVDPGNRPDSVGQLRQAGWHMADRSNFEFLAEYGRGPELGVEDIWAHPRWVFGTKPS
jgi:hypothetical protein